MKENLICHLAAVQRRSSSVEDFEFWLMGHMQEIIDCPDQELRRLANRLDALLIELGEDVVSAAELDEEFEGILCSLTTLREEYNIDSIASRSVVSANDETIKRWWSF